MVPGKRAHDESFWKIFEAGQTVWKNYEDNKPYQEVTVGPVDLFDNIIYRDLENVKAGHVPDMNYLFNMMVKVM